MRCSLAYIRSVSASALLIEQERAERGPFLSLVDLCRRRHFLSWEQVEWLFLAGALDSLNPNRRQTLWSLPSLHAGHGRLRQDGVNGQVAAEIDMPPLPGGLADFTPGEAFLRQWQAIGNFPIGYPLCFYRERLEAAGVLPCAALDRASAGQFWIFLAMSSMPIGKLSIRQARW